MNPLAFLGGVIFQFSGAFLAMRSFGTYPVASTLLALAVGRQFYVELCTDESAQTLAAARAASGEGVRWFSAKDVASHVRSVSAEDSVAILERLTARGLLEREFNAEHFPLYRFPVRRASALTAGEEPS